ncbi:HD domain-containing protein [Cloacibacillus evryensis]|uniref:HD domain-containing protein n=1 Tax=Cloacibacillus evryensis TaxID=508460 RepID=UPI0022DFE4F1|nr:HD domain-containing protein [Cloacibacillus evryensis]
MKLQRVRDPLYNLIEFREERVDDLLWQIIQTEAFQRLRRIKQLGFSEFVYPGATHTRFAHSLGVFHLARRLIEIIDVKLKKRGSPTSNNAEKDAALCAALLHDLGHGPFSHAFEEVGKKFQLASVNHESITDKLIREGEIGVILDRYYKGFRNNVAAAIGEHSDIYSSVVSGQFDADRLDYMQRDRMMTEDHPICKFVNDMSSWQSSLLLDDTVIWGMLEQLRGADDRNIRELSERLYNRKLFKSIKMPIKDVLIKNNIKKKEQDKEEIIKRFLNKAYPDLLSDIKNWNDEHSNVSDKIFMDMVRRGSYNNPKANRSRSNQILAVDEKQRIVSLTDISDVVRSIGPFVEIRGYVSEYGGDAENYLKDRVKNYKMTEVA